MTDDDTVVDARARQASASLAGWAPERPPGSPAERFARMASRRRRSRLGAAASVVLLAGAGAAVGLTGDAGSRVETTPAADSTRPGPDTTDAPTTEPPTTETSTTDAPATTVPTTETPPTTTAPPTTPVPAADPTCERPLVGGGTLVVTMPAGWTTNEDPEGTVDRSECLDFGPARDGQVGTPLVSISDHGELAGESWEDVLADAEAYAQSLPPEQAPLSSSRATVAGQPALRQEWLYDGTRVVGWSILAGDTMVDADADELDAVAAGMSYEDMVAALDQMVLSLEYVG